MCADRPDIPVLDSSEAAEEVARVLEDRLYEFNVGATGFADGKDVCFTVADERGEMIGGVAGYTWGGCCYIRQLWVAEGQRLRGLGRALLAAAEREARLRNCRQILLSSHSFQAPEFYARLGYIEIARIEGHPTGHASIFLAKPLV
jgi:GNAT superfamily N-acetyltransferase